MRPFDPRLLCYACSTRDPIVVAVLLGTLTALLVLAQAFLVPTVLSLAVLGTASLTDVRLLIVETAVASACRTLIVAARKAVSTRTAAAAVRELCGRVADMIVTLGSRWKAVKGTETTTLLPTRPEDLRPYFVSFLPQLVFTCTVTPMALGAILLLDFWSALIASLIILLIPIFVILTGRFTQVISEDRFASMKRLTAQLLDLVSGLPTLRGLSREEAPRVHLHALGAANTRATMTTLRVAFLSGGVLELLTTLSVALVAVKVDMRLVFGNILLFHGLAVIMLAPGVFDPLCQVDTQSHTSANGVTASRTAFDIIEGTEAIDSSGTDECLDVARTDIALDGLGVCARGAWAPAPASGVVTPGIVTALCDSSGVGKPTIVLCLPVDTTPDTGRVPLRPSVSSSESGESVLSDIDLAAWRHQISWVPQSPTLVPDTILDNMGGLPLDDLDDAAATTGFDDVLANTPDGWNTVVGSGGVDLSVGQRQCLALA